MLYHLLYPLREHFFAFNVFKYITFRSAYATVTALLLCFVVGPWIIRRLRAGPGRPRIRREGPESHQVKAGTPTMGGILIVGAIVIPTLLWANLANRYVWLVLLSTVWLGALGFLDDYLHVVRKEPKGLLGRYKLLGQIALGLIVGSVLAFAPRDPVVATLTNVPFLKDRYLDFGFLYVPFVVLVITASSNAVNLTDGLDGLAIGMVAIAGLAFAGLAYLSGNVRFSDYLNILYLDGTGELAVVCAALVGASLGFLWFNCHPADVFMGDTGALALGGTLGTLAVLVKREFLLVVIGGMFVAEAVSVILQVVSFKLRGKRIFRMAPLHHHFELTGWPEPRVVVRFWIIASLLALLSVSTLKLQ